MDSVSIIGVGRLGGALTLAFQNAGVEVPELVVRDRSDHGLSEHADRIPAEILEFEDLRSIRSDTILLAVRDGQIGPVAESISRKIEVKGKVVLHTSGSKDSSALEPLRLAGAVVGSIHPLVSISGPFVGSSRFAGSFFCVEGQKEAVDRAARDHPQ